MATGYQTPGVYREEVILKSAPELQTGVPGFLGFVKRESADLFKEPVLLNRNHEFDVRFEKHFAEGSYLADAVQGFFSNGGARCYVAVAGFSLQEDPKWSNEGALKTALDSLSALTDLDLIAAPDAMLLKDVEAVKRVQIEMLKHCQEHGNRFAILDALPKGVSDVIVQRNQISSGLREPINGALYYPWLVLSTSRRMLPPSGHIAGIFGRSDARVGVFKAPANEEIIGAMDLCVGKPDEFVPVEINNQVQDQLNPAGINCLRAFPGRGIRVWGARSLRRDHDWRYVNVCRLGQTLPRWVDAHP